MFNYCSFSWCRKEAIRKRNYVFAFGVAFCIPLASAYLRSFMVLWQGKYLYKAVNPLGTPEQCVIFIVLGTITFIALIPFLRFRLLRWFIALVLCAFWFYMYMGCMGIATQK
jgi:hypothetical protein